MLMTFDLLMYSLFFILQSQEKTIWFVFHFSKFNFSLTTIVIKKPFFRL